MGSQNKVLTNISQSLSDTAKKRARDNIGAAPAGQFGYVDFIYNGHIWDQVQAVIDSGRIPVLRYTGYDFLPVDLNDDGRYVFFGEAGEGLNFIYLSVYKDSSTPDLLLVKNAAYVSVIDNIAPQFNGSVVYHKGALISSTNKTTIYRCIVNNSTPGSFNSSEWTQTTIADELARKGDYMKTITMFATSACSYTFTGNARAAVFSKVSEVLDFKTLSTGTVNTVSVGFKAGETVNIVSAKVKAGQAAGLQSPAISSGVTGLCASLQFELIALDNAGDVVESTYITTYLKELDWNVFEKKGIELTTPSTLPAGATCFGIRYGGAFSCDDYNIQDDYVGQTVTPELVLEIATESETVVDVATGTEIGY